VTGTIVPHQQGRPSRSAHGGGRQPVSRRRCLAVLIAAPNVPLTCTFPTKPVPSLVSNTRQFSVKSCAGATLGGLGRPLGYEHPNRRLSPLPWSPPSLHILGRAGRGVSSVATRAEPSRLVLVTGLVTGSQGRASRPLPPPTVIVVHARGYTSTWSPITNLAKPAVLPTAR
jgi:hypothetical protein